MPSIASLGLLSLQVLATLRGTNAIPSLNRDVPKDLVITPGPGLPSLESMNLTAADIWKMETPQLTELFGSPSSALGRRDDGYCYSGETAPLDPIRACYNLMLYYDTRNCATDREGPKGADAGAMYGPFCQAEVNGGRATVVGFPYPPSKQKTVQSSFCRDVATAIDWVVKTCQYPDGIGGFQFAGGNGNLKVVTGRPEYGEKFS